MDRWTPAGFVIGVLKNHDEAGIAKKLADESEPKVREIVAELVNDPESDYWPVLREWGERYPNYIAVVKWVCANRNIDRIVEELRRLVRQRGVRA